MFHVVAKSSLSMPRLFTAGTTSIWMGDHTTIGASMYTNINYPCFLIPTDPQLPQLPGPPQKLDQLKNCLLLEK